MYTLLRRKLEGLREEAIDFARELVQTPSTTYHEGAVAGKVRERLEELGYEKVAADDAGNVVGVLFGREAEPTLLLASHMDTVAADRPEQWKHDPLSGAIEAGKLYGLGAADCKGGLTAQLYAGALLKRSLLPLRGNLVVAATSAEGNGRSVGIRELLAKSLPAMGLLPTAALLGEPTGLSLYYGHDGWVEIELRIEGNNRFRVDDAAKAVVDICSASDGQGESAPLVEGPRFLDTAGGRAATITMKRRISNAESLETVLRQVRRDALLAVQSADTAVEVEVSHENRRTCNGRYHLVRNLSNAWGIDPYDPLVERARQALAAAGSEVHPGRWRLGRFGMGTAGSVLVNEFGVPTVGYGPGAEELVHARDEWVELEKLIGAVLGTAVIAHGLIGIPVFGWTSDEI